MKNRSSAFSKLVLSSMAAAAAFTYSASVLADDAPNTKYEKKLDKIYKNYNDAPTDSQLWEMARMGAGKKTYKTQKGDTLWDISEMLFGDGNYWPKVWSLNKNILNPHDVPPGSVLSFSSAADSTDAPEMDVMRGHMPPEAVPEVLALTANVDIPEAKKESPPPLTDLPESLPKWKFKKDPSAVIKMDLKSRPNYNGNDVRVIPYFVTDQELKGEGTIEGTEVGLHSAAENQYIFIKFKNRPSTKTYSIYHFDDSFDDKQTDHTGYVYTVEGEVEVLGLVDGNENIYRAIVKKSVHLVEVGAKVVAEPLPMMEMTHPASLSSVTASICWGHFGRQSRLFGPDTIVILNKGSKAGVAVGQKFPIYQKLSLRDDNTLEKSNPRQVAAVRIVRVSGNFSTAVVTEMAEPIQVGDTTDQGVLAKLPDLPPALDAAPLELPPASESKTEVPPSPETQDSEAPPDAPNFQ